MAGFLLYHKKTRPTGRAIAEGLGIPHGANPERIPADVDTVIRWGNAKTIPRQGLRFINDARSIMLAGDKLQTLQRLQEVGVPCLRFYENLPDEEGVYFARKRRGFGGKDISIVSRIRELNPTAFPGDAPFTSRILVRGTNLEAPAYADEEARRIIAEADFFTRWVDNRREYRIHVVDGEIIRFQRKYLLDAAPRPRFTSLPRVQNHSNGYVFQQPRNRLNRDRFEAATRAVEELGLQFGAVDLIVTNTKIATPVVLEVNTAASCSPRTRDAYIEAFRNLL